MRAAKSRDKRYPCFCINLKTLDFSWVDFIGHVAGYHDVSNLGAGPNSPTLKSVTCDVGVLVPITGVPGILHGRERVPDPMTTTAAPRQIS
jgi:hypothetical protein